MRTELRDVALAALIQLTGQSHKDYNFAFTRTYIYNNGSNVLFTMADSRILGFGKDEERAAALRKWKEWSASRKELQVETKQK